MQKYVLIEADNVGVTPIQNGLEIRRVIPRKTVLANVAPDTSACAFLANGQWLCANYRPDRKAPGQDVSWAWDLLVSTDVVDQLLAALGRGVEGQPE